MKKFVPKENKPMYKVVFIKPTCEGITLKRCLQENEAFQFALGLHAQSNIPHKIEVSCMVDDSYVHLLSVQSLDFDSNDDMPF